MRRDYTPPRLKVGDVCWHRYAATLLREVVITEVRILCEGEQHEFAMYRASCAENNLRDDESLHRSDLFLKPAERRQLIGDLEGDIESLGYAIEELQTEQEEEDEARRLAEEEHG